MVTTDLEKRIGETPREYHKRLIYGKLEDKTLSDYDWDELSEFLFGKQLARDETRKRAYGSYYNFKLEEEEGANNANECVTDVAPATHKIMAGLDEKIAFYQREAQKYFDQRREYKKLNTSEARWEHLVDRLSDAASQLPDSVGDICVSDFSPFDSGTEAVLVFADWHYGMTTDNIFNTYNTDICKQRVDETVAKAIKRIRQHSCDKLHVVVLGDLIHGAIHTSARVASEELTADQLIQASEILAQAIIHLASNVPETHVYMTYGNHARTVANKNDSVHRDNMERIVPWWLEQKIAAFTAQLESKYGESFDITIEPESPNEFLLLNVCGHDVVAAHGDADAIKTSPKTLATLFRRQYARDIEYILLGDKHHREDFEELGVTAMLCGALCGSDDYANGKRLYSVPSQMLLIFNDVEGLDAEYRLKCE